MEKSPFFNYDFGDYKRGNSKNQSRMKTGRETLYVKNPTFYIHQPNIKKLAKLIENRLIIHYLYILFVNKCQTVF